MPEKKIILAFCFAFCAFCLFPDKRSFSDVYPMLGEDEIRSVFSDEGLVVAGGRGTAVRFFPRGLDSGFAAEITNRKPLFLTESARVVPYTKNTEPLDIYNALNNVQGLKGRKYPSFTRKKDVPLFEDATRIESPKKTNAVTDPPRALIVPGKETVYIKLKDVNFGDSYYQGDIYSTGQGILYNMKNFRHLYVLFVPLIKAGDLNVQIYFEPLKEGLLIYSAAGVEVSGLTAHATDIPSAVRKRINVIIEWVRDGVS